jgi:hypothetical protein
MGRDHLGGIYMVRRVMLNWVFEEVSYQDVD